MRRKDIAKEVLATEDDERPRFIATFMRECYGRAVDTKPELAVYWKLCEIAQRNCEGCKRREKPHLHQEVCLLRRPQQGRH